MKIMVVAPSFSSNISGIQRHALNLVRCLMRRSEITRVDLIVAPWQAKLAETLHDLSSHRLTIHFEQMREGPLSRNLWYYCELPGLAKRLGVDLVHLSYPVPVHAAAFSCPTVLSLHDLYPLEIPENFGFAKAIANRWILQQCLRSVSSIACVSDATLHNLKQQCATGNPARKAVRIHNCVEPTADSIRLHTYPALRNERFLLTVAQHRKNKNIPLLIRAFHRLMQSATTPMTKLVVVGIEGPETQSIRSLIAHLRLDEYVLLVHGLSEVELQWCYAHCEALVAPSRTEGFGLPIAEALLAGSRVVCSDIAAFREIGGSHCRFVALGPSEELDLTTAIAETISGPPGTRISFPRLSSETLSHEYVQLYGRLLRQKPTITEVSGRNSHCALGDDLAFEESPAPDVRKLEG